jgi:hypothetical protein
MSLDLKFLVWAVGLALLQCVIAAVGARTQVGLLRLAGNRDGLPEITG